MSWFQSLQMALGTLTMFGGLVVLSIVGFLVAFNNLGQYNIGGVPNKIGAKVLTWILLLAIGYGWYAALSHVHVSIS